MAGVLWNILKSLLFQMESGCRNVGCKMDVGSLSCGYFQIKEAYWIDCGRPGSSKHLFAHGVIMKHLRFNQDWQNFAWQADKIVLSVRNNLTYSQIAMKESNTVFLKISLEFRDYFDDLVFINYLVFFQAGNLVQRARIVPHYVFKNTWSGTPGGLDVHSDVRVSLENITEAHVVAREAVP